jgi:hypothetical protein
VQWRIARNKLRLDLFDRRWQVYAATRTFLDGILNDPARDVDSRPNDFNAGTSNAEFLFGGNVLDYIERVRTRAVDLRTALVLSDEKQPDGEERTCNIKKVEADLNWLIEQSTAMTKVFAPYLGFANIKA